MGLMGEGEVGGSICSMFLQFVENVSVSFSIILWPYFTLHFSISGDGFCLVLQTNIISLTCMYTFFYSIFESV